MPITASVFIATSLDGFIAKPDGSIDWLMEANERVPAGEDCGYAQFMADIDVLVMGRNTFEQVCTFDPWPYSNHKVVVLSSNKVNIPPHLENSVTTSSEDPAQLLKQLETQGFKRVYVDGGKTIQSFLALGLITNLTITTIPILLGTGRPLFGPLSRNVALRLIQSKAFEFGFVQNTYEVLPSIVRADNNYPTR